MTMPTDATTGPSVVAVNAESVAEERDRRAREELARAAASPLRLLTWTGVSLTVPYKLAVVSRDDDRAVIDNIMGEVFEECDRVLNDYNPASEVGRINAAAAGTRFDLSPYLAAVLECAHRVTRGTGGAFDVAARPIADFLVEFAARNHGRHPTPMDREAWAEMHRLLEFCSFTVSFEIERSGKSIVLAKKNGEAKLCLGGISKGATIDRMIERLGKAGFRNVLFEWGGDAKGVGRNHEGQLWRIGILAPPTLAQLQDGGRPAQVTAGDTGVCVAAAGADPNIVNVVSATGGAPLTVCSEDRKYIRVCALDNEAIATSGDWENRVDKTSLMTKTFDVKAHTLLSATPHFIAQSSVKSPSAMVADALATAAFAKKEFRLARWMLEGWRYVRNPVHDFTLYIRDGEKVTVMHEIASETSEQRHERIGLSIPARVLVVGGGLAGCAAAIEAAGCGASVVLIEKEATLGGNSAKATSGMNAWGTRPQGALDIADDGKYFERDTFLSGKGGNADPALVKMLSVKSRDALHWVMRETGLSLTTISQLGGHSRRRTHRAPDQKDGTPVPIGFTIMQLLIHGIETKFRGRIAVMTNTSVVSVLHQSEVDVDETRRVKVQGVRYKDNRTGQEEELLADSIVVTTGGFANDHSESSLLKEFRPDLAETPTTNGGFATGDGVKMARELGATLVDMDKIQLHPTGFVNPKEPAAATKYLGPEALRGSGGVLINGKGQRFVNELDLRSVVSKAINNQGDVYPESKDCRFAHCVLNKDAIRLFGPNSLSFYKDKIGLFKDVADVAALAKHIDCDESTLVKTLDEYEASVKKGHCDLTGKNVFPCAVGSQGPFVVAAITPSIHYTMGGIAINTAAEVLISDEKRQGLFGKRRPVLGLFAAGEVSAGVHGGNRLGGNSLLECVVFGRIAGDRAATILQRSRAGLSFSDWTTVVLREINEGEEFGQGSRILRFNLPGALQISGLSVGQFVAIRGEWDGQQLVGYYSPISLPNDTGVISILARVDKGNLREWIAALRPGDAVHMRACGGLAIERIPGSKHFQFNRKPVRRIGLIAGGTGIAPMLQILRAATKKPYVDGIQSIHLLYAAETAEELTYQRVLLEFDAMSKGKFHCHFVVNNPPPGWTQGVGFIDLDTLRSHMSAPTDDLLIAICGPPVMQRLVTRNLVKIGHNPEMIRTVDEIASPASKL